MCITLKRSDISCKLFSQPVKITLNQSSNVSPLQLVFRSRYPVSGSSGAICCLSLADYCACLPALSVTWLLEKRHDLTVSSQTAEASLSKRLTPHEL